MQILFIANDFIHIVSAATWVGGLIYLNLVLAPSLLPLELSQKGIVEGGVAKRFSLLAWPSAIALLITGMVKLPSGVLLDFSHSYAALLNIKIAVYFVMILIGAQITFSLGPRIGRLASRVGEQPPPEFFIYKKRVALLSRIVLGLGVMIFAFVSWL